jgi:hypothetical protein
MTETSWPFACTIINVTLYSTGISHNDGCLYAEVERKYNFIKSLVMFPDPDLPGASLPI